MGAAVNAAGNAESGMGVDAGDFDNDGDEDLFVTNWLSQMNTPTSTTARATSKSASRGLTAEPRENGFAPPGSISTMTAGSISDGERGRRDD
jgi:hypothetical protein